MLLKNPLSSEHFRLHSDGVGLATTTFTLQMYLVCIICLPDMSSTATDDADNLFSNIFTILLSSSVGYDNVAFTLNHRQFSEC